MRGGRRYSIDDREPGIDLFDDPPWRADRGVRSPNGEGRLLTKTLDTVAAVVLAVFAVAGVAVAALLVLTLHLHFSLGGLGPFDVTPADPADYGMDVVVSPDGALAYVTEPSADQVVVVDTATGTVRAIVAVGADPTGLALSPDGAELWVVDTNLLGVFGPQPTTTTVAGPPSGGPSGGDGAVTIVSTVTDTVVGSVTVGVGPIDVAFSPDGARAYVTDNDPDGAGQVSVITTATRTVVGTVTIPGPSGLGGLDPTSVAVGDDGHEVWVSEVDDLAVTASGTATTAAGDDDGAVVVVSAATGAEVARVAVGAGPFFLVASGDGREMFVADKVSCDVRRIDTATFAVTGTVKWPAGHGCPYGLAGGGGDETVETVTGDDHTFAAGKPGTSVGYVDFATATAVVTGSVGDDPVTVALADGGERAYVVDADAPLLDEIDPASGTVTAVVRLQAVAASAGRTA